MALLSRIFQGRRNRTPSAKWYVSEVNKQWSEPTFSQSQVRLVIFRDQDFKGRGLLFDSKAVHRVSETEQNEKKGTCKFGCGSRKPPPGPTDDTINNANSSTKYTLSRPGSDTKMLEEMVFGTVGMAFRGSSLKVHTIRSPAQLMLTKVFVPSLNRARESGVEGESLGTSLDYSLNCSSTELTSPQKINDKSPRSSSNMAQSVPMDVPSPPQRCSYEETYQPDTEDSGFSTSAASSLSSFAASLPRSSSSSSLTSNSLTSMTRRWRRNQQTSLEHHILKRQSDEGVCDQPVPLAKRPPKIGMAIIIYLPESREEASKEFQDFFFSHITLIEGLVNKLKVGLERALSNRKLFVPMTVEVLETFRQLIGDLYLTPRLEEPVWLHMMCYTTHRVSLCQRFLREFMTALSKYDTKNTKFFLSTLITGVLTHHLAWVPTVTPAGATPSRTYLDKHSAKWLDAVAKSHPYNPLWAQLGDLYGAIGFPVRLSRTVVVGRKADLVNKLLYILSYFIRCSEVLERVERPHEFDDFSVDEDAPELSIDGQLWSDTISQTSSSSVRSFPALLLRPAELVSSPETCTQCHTNSNTNSKTTSDVTSARVVTSPTHSQTGSECFKVRLKGGGQEDMKDVKEKLNSPKNVPDGSLPSTDVDEFIYNVNITQQRTAEYVNSVQCCAGIIGEEDTCNMEVEVSSDCDFSLTYPGAVIASSAPPVSNNKVESHNQTSKTNHCDSPTAVLPSHQDSRAHECRMSPTRVNEEPRTTQIRHVGREATPERTITTDIQSDLDKSVTDGKLESGLESFENSLSSELEQRIEYSHDSGMYDTVISVTKTHTEGSNQLSPTVTCHRGLPQPNPSTTTPAHTDTKLSSQSADSNLPIPLNLCNFSRSNSMFDEYFSDESEPVPLVRNASSRTKSEADRFKRMASIEGSSSIFDEYMNIPCPDITTRISEVSLTSLRSANAEEVDVNKEFNEYFTDSDEVKNDGEEMKNMESETLVDGEKPLVHLAERRNAKRPDTLLMKVGGDGERGRPRQMSGQSTVTLMASRTHSATPTELNRRRHASNLSTTSSIEADVFHNLKEVNMPRCELLSADIATQAPKASFSRSLLAGFSPHYLSDFVLHGTSDTNFQAKLHQDLTMSVQNSVLDEPISEAVAVVADMEEWSVKLHTYHYERPDRVRMQDISPSPLVCNIVESVHDLWKLKMSPEFCLMHLEDRLQEIFFKSRTLAEYICSQKRIDIKKLATQLKLDCNDIPLLLAVAGTHTQHRSMAFL